jgi:hypothetical protein
MNKSLNRSLFKVAFDLYLNSFGMNAYVYCNHLLILYSILNVCSLNVIHPI